MTASDDAGISEPRSTTSDFHAYQLYLQGKFHLNRRGEEPIRRSIELFKAAYDGWFGQNEEDLSSLFCSELVAEAYQRMGLISDGKKALPSNEFTPKDFSSEAAKPLKLRKKAKLKKEVVVTF